LYKAEGRYYVSAEYENRMRRFIYELFKLRWWPSRNAVHFYDLCNIEFIRLKRGHSLIG
jgi:hypothetical protein